MTRLTNAQRDEALSLVADTKRSLPYHAACVWLERVRRCYDRPEGVADEHQNGWLDLYRLQDAIKLSMGVHCEESTLVLALDNTGFKLRSTRRGLQTNLNEIAVLNVIRSTDFGTRPARPRPDLSDPTDAQMGMH